MSQAAVRDYLFVAQAFCWMSAGGLLGLLHLASLRWIVRCLLGGRLWSSLGLQLLRFAAAGGALMLATKLFGAMPLLAGAFGLVVARKWVLLLETRR
jgi:hypothetical protein